MNSPTTSKGTTLGVCVASVAMALFGAGAASAEPASQVDAQVAGPQSREGVTVSELSDEALSDRGISEVGSDLVYSYSTDMAAASENAGGVALHHERTELEGLRSVRDGAAGCEFRLSAASEDAPNDDYVYVARRVRANPEDCTVVMESAWVPQAAAENILPALEKQASSERPESTVNSGQYVAPTLASASNDGRIKGFIEDPPQLDVASAFARIRWGGSGCPSGWTKSNDTYWLSSTGWNRTAVDFDRTSGSCWEFNRTFAHFLNTKFCASIDTNAEIDVEFTAKGHHSSDASWDVDSWGGCSWLLNNQHYYDPY